VTSSQVARCLYFVGLLIGVSSGTWAAPIYNFTTIDLPGGTETFAHGINDAGQIVGSFGDATVQHGFLKDGSTFTMIDVPGATGTEANGINSAGQIVGIFRDATGTHGFLKDGDTFTTLNYPGAADTLAYGINDSGQIVGVFNAGGQGHGFLYTAGSFTTTPLLGTGINDSGQIVGTGGNSSLLYSDGNLTIIHYPGSIATYAIGINNSGEIAGWFSGSGAGRGFLDTGGTFTSIDVPGANNGTYAQGINDSGQIVGYFVDPVFHGFLATPIPEPATWLLFGSGGLVGLCSPQLRRGGTART
jgi:probable HAF family extracellular repeat protein